MMNRNRLNGCKRDCPINAVFAPGDFLISIVAKRF